MLRWHTGHLYGLAKNFTALQVNNCVCVLLSGQRQICLSVNHACPWMMLLCSTNTSGMARMPQNLDRHHTAKRAGGCYSEDARTS